jgi:hypothetical protein
VLSRYIKCFEKSPITLVECCVYVVLVLQALCVEGAPMNRASRSIPNYLIRLLPPLTMHNMLPYAVEVKVPTISYDVRIEAGEKTNIYFLNLLKMHKICVEVFMCNCWYHKHFCYPFPTEDIISYKQRYHEIYTIFLVSVYMRFEKLVMDLNFHLVFLDLDTINH